MFEQFCKTLIYPRPVQVSMPKKNPFEVRLVKEWPTDEIVNLYKAGGWWKDYYDPKGVLSIINGSFGFAVAVEVSTGRAVGMARAISDGVSDAYIQDMVVLPEHRKKGLGRMLIELLVQDLKTHGVHWIGLIAEDGAAGFYEKLGFVDLKWTPMLYKKE
jgi:aralkylamine N-acetyltransferase